MNNRKTELNIQTTLQICGVFLRGINLFQTITTPRVFRTLYCSRGLKADDLLLNRLQFSSVSELPFCVVRGAKAFKRVAENNIYLPLPLPIFVWHPVITLISLHFLTVFFSLLFQAKNPTNALGRAANGVSPEAMSSLGTIANIPAPNRSNVVIATDVSADPIIWPFTWNVTHPGDLFKIRTV